MRQRLVAALLFGSAAAVNGLIVWLLAGRGELWGMAVIINVILTSFLAVLATPLLLKGTRRSSSRCLGFSAGALLTLVSILATHIIVIQLLFMDGPDGLFGGVPTALISALTPLAILSTFGSPLLGVGGIAGAAFWHAADSPVTPAT